MMPTAGSLGRAQQLATIGRFTHELAIASEVGEWLDALAGADLSDLDRDLVRIARRDYDRLAGVPGELTAQMAAASSEGEDAWVSARAEGSFAAFVPALERNLALARQYAECVGAPGQDPYDALLGDYDFGLTGARISEVFGRLAAELPAIVAGAEARTPHTELAVPVEAQRVAVERALARVGLDGTAWRVDVSTHPFTSWVSANDIRLTTRYEDGQLESVLAAMHEFGHGLYERQMDPELARTNLSTGTSMSVHESQSKLWENHVGRHRAFADGIAADLAAGGFAVAPDELHAALVAVRPSLIRVSADPVTYPLHIVLRFELERALVNGTLAVADLPSAWNEGMRRLLGVDVPDDASGVLQDVHWAAGAFGYFPSYALGCLIAAQLWEALEADLGDQSDALARGDLEGIRGWLGEHVHRHGRRLDTEELVEAATGRGLDVEPFLRHARALAG
jgi:carboxypeptidase Taq